MDFRKDFQQMSEEERLTYISEFTSFMNTEKAHLQTLDTEGVKTFNKALSLLTAFAPYYDFVQQSVRFCDYSRRKDALLVYLDEVTNLIAQQQGLTASVDALEQHVAERMKPHRGRPTKAEQAAKKAQKEADRKEKAKTSMFKEEDTAEDTEKAFDANAAMQMAALSGSQLHLDQLAFLLSDDLAKKVTDGNIRTMRRQFEDAYAEAKRLAQAGKEEEAATQAQLAHDLNAQIEGIYEAVDTELAACFLRLKEDDPYIEQMKQKVNNIKEVISICRPYHKKVSEADHDFDAKIRAQIKENAPEAVAAREAAKDTHDKAAAIIKYLRRTDKPNTDKRLATMRKKLDELHTLIGDEANAYEPLLDAAKADNERLKG